MSPTVLDDLGDPVPLRGRPQRIVSLVPNLSETLWWWHLADHVVGVTEFCVAPPHAFPDAARVRGTKNTDTAAVVDLEPDVVVANQEENRELDVRRLRDAGVAVYVTSATTLDTAATSLADLGAALGVPDAGAGLAQGMRRAIATAPRDVTPLATFCPIWRDPWMAVGTSTIAGDLLRVAGFDVLPHEPRYPRVDLDDVASADPDVVLLPDEPYEFGDEDKRVFTDWRARTRLVDGTALTWWGPRTPSSVASFARLAAHLRRRTHS